MKFKVNNSFSEERAVRGGSPQGTKLGNLLFIISIDNIEEVWQEASPASPIGPADESQVLNESSLSNDNFGLRSLAGRIGAVRRFDSSVAVASTPHKTENMASVLRYKDTSGRDLSSQPMIHAKPSSMSDENVWHDKYVDDVNAGEICSTDDSVHLISQNKEQRVFWAKGCERSFTNICRNSALIGMKVNPLKTQLICLSGVTHSDISCYINTEEGRISSQDSMTLLGFDF